jgi:hypothetical protein
MNRWALALDVFETDVLTGFVLFRGEVRAVRENVCGDRGGMGGAMNVNG